MPRQSGDQHWTKRTNHSSIAPDPISWLLKMNDRTVRDVAPGNDQVIVQIAMGPKDQEFEGYPLTLDDMAVCVNAGVSPDRAEEIAAQLIAAAAKVRAGKAN